MSQSSTRVNAPNESAAAQQPPPTNADMTPQATLGARRFPFSASTLRAYTMLIALVVIWIFFAWMTRRADAPYGVFLEARNFSNLMRQTAVTGVLAVGMLMVILTGQIDLAVGSVVGLTGAIAAILMNWMGYGFAASLAVGIGVGILIGFAQGALVAYLNIPAFIVTLGGLLAWRGVVKGVTKGETIPVPLASFRNIGQQYMAKPAGWAIAALAVAAIAWLAFSKNISRRRSGLAPESVVTLALKIVAPSIVVLAFVAALNAYNGIPFPVIILLAVALAGAFLTQNTTFGRYLYAIGGNPEAARLSGINIRAHILSVFAIMGALAGVAGMIYTARVGSASPDAGVLLELDAIAACVIGGASLMGGRGTILGACIGALFMQSLNNGMSLLNVQDYMQDIVKGVILVTAVGLDMVGRRRV